MNKERLTKLRDLLVYDMNNPNGVQFDMGNWGKPADEREWAYDEDEPKVDCGTQACAFGLAAISGIFKEEGLTYRIYSGRLEPVYKDDSEYEAAQYFFDISLLAAWMLFDPWYYSERRSVKAEQEVIERIDSLLATGGCNEIISDFLTPEQQENLRQTAEEYDRDPETC